MSANLRKDLGLDLQQWAQLEKSVKYELNLKKNCVGLKGYKGQSEKWDLWLREFLQGDSMKMFKKLKGQTELCRLRNWIMLITERKAHRVLVGNAVGISLDASQNSNQQLGGLAKDTTRATQAPTHQPKVSSEQQIRELFSAGKRSRNALIRKTLGLTLPQWENLLLRIRGGLVKWVRGFNNNIQLSQNNKTSWDKWLRWIIKDSDGCWSNRQADINVLLACFGMISTTMIESGFGNRHITVTQKVSQTAAAATNHTGPPVQSSVVAPKLNACQSKGTIPDISCVKRSPGCAPVPGGVPHSLGKTISQTGHLTQKIGSNQGRELNSATPAKNPGPSRPSFATKEEPGIARPSAFRGDMKFEHNALGFRSRPSSRLPKKHLTYHGIGGLHLYKDVHLKTSQQLIPQPLGAGSSGRPLPDSCESLVVPCVKFRRISDETPIVEISAQATTAQLRVWIPAPRKSSQEEDDYDVF